MVYGGSKSSPSSTFEKPSFTVTSAFFYFNIDLSFWMRVEPQVMLNNVCINVDTETWPSAPEQRYTQLPPLTEHSMISVRSEQALPVILILGGFRSYLRDGVTPDPATYNLNIYYSFYNGATWIARGPKSRTPYHPTTYTANVGVNWMTPRSAAALFAHKITMFGYTAILVHGGRHFDGSYWTNGGALDDIWFFPLEACIYPGSANYEMWVFATHCEMTPIATTTPRYFHNIFRVPFAGADYFVLTGGFASNGIAALQSQITASNGTFGVWFCSGVDVMIAVTYNRFLQFKWLPIRTNAPSFCTSSLMSTQYNRFVGAVFMFGGSDTDFSRFPNISSNSFKMHNQLWFFKFDPISGTSFMKEVNAIGNLPSKRAAAIFFESGDKVTFSGGIDADLVYRPNVYELSIVRAHPNLTRVYGDALNGGFAGDMRTIFVSSQTILLKPAFSCESCFAASVQGEAAGAPSYNLFFEAAGTDSEAEAAVYKSSFIPLVSGSYVISVSTLQSSVANGMPFLHRIQILPSVTCSSTSQFIYSKSVMAGSSTKFTIQCLDAFSNMKQGGDIIFASIYRMQGQTGTELSRTEDEFTYTYTDLKSGSHALEFTLTRSSVYSIGSKLGMQLIRDQMFSFVVVPEHALCNPFPRTCNTFVFGKLDSIFAGQATPMSAYVFICAP
jgi:hypothetical protein